MSIPIILPTGMVAVYGNGNQGITETGVIIEGTQRYGTIYNIWSGGAPYIYGGDKIIFNESDVNCRIATSNGLTYTILPARLVTKQTVEA
jgi:hypothetical protein